MLALRKYVTSITEIKKKNYFIVLVGVFHFELRPIGLETADFLYTLIDIFSTAEFEWLFCFSLFRVLDFTDFLNGWMVGRTHILCFPHCLFIMTTLWNIFSFFSRFPMLKNELGKLREKFMFMFMLFWSWFFFYYVAFHLCRLEIECSHCGLRQCELSE